jgi:FSR family fosmidomycin resistance protein-like MFS transporter
LEKQDLGRAAGILSYGLIAMTFTHALTHVFQGIHPAIFKILKDEYSLSLQQLGIIAAIPPLCQALLSIPTGLLSDRFGSKKMILVSLAVALGGALLASQTVNPLMFIAAISLVYVNTTIYHPASYSFTTRLFRPRDRSKALGLHGAGGTFGVALGPLSVSLLVGVLALGWRQVYLFWVLPVILGILMVLRIRKEPVEDAPDEAVDKVSVAITGQSLFTFSLVMFLVFGATRNMAGAMISNFLVIYLEEARGLTLAVASLVSSGTTLFGFIAAPLGGYLASRFGEKRWILASLALSYACLGLSIAFPNVVWFVALYLAYGFCNTLSMAANSSVMARLSPSRQRGLGYALYFLPGSLMGAVAPVIAGYVAEAYGFTIIFYISLVIYAAALAILKLFVDID